MEILTNSDLARTLRAFRGGNSALLSEAADRLESPNLRGHYLREPLTKLERFTLGAMQGIIANPSAMEKIMKASSKTGKDIVNLTANVSIEYAQAALAQLVETDT